MQIPYTGTAEKDDRGCEKRGLVDIIIGTHRVLSEDLKFKDLGLLIIDEEQRFGVQHKEKSQEIEGKYRCIDTYSDSDPENTSYEPDRYSRYECIGGSTE